MRTRRGATRQVLRIGIASYEEMKARSLAIARGELKPASDEPKIWFPSAETFGKVLSGRNRELLAQIRAARPRSLQALSDLTGREVSNLSRTLKTMELYGLVELKRGARGMVRPEVPYDEVDVRVPLRMAAE
jgi:predicted transcriptional regulator